MESAAANEVLAAGRNYREFLIYPRAMFLAVYETGLHFYMLAAAAVLVAHLSGSPPVYDSLRERMLAKPAGREEPPPAP